jgi:hypothetical protein
MGLAVKITTILMASTLFAVIMLLPASAGKTKVLPDQSPAIVISTQEVKNGSSLLVEIDTRHLNPPITDMRLIFGERFQPVFQHPTKSDRFYFGLLGIPYRSTPGPASLKLEWSNASGNHSQSIPFEIVSGKYRTDTLKVDPKRVNPSKEDAARAKREQQEVMRIYATGSMSRLWEGPFRLPIESDITSPFGNRRVFNDQLKSYHNGIDFRAQNGTPAFAANSGIVRLAKNLFYSGNVVLIDHGTEIFTIYAHLNKINVAAGRQIEKGQMVGLTGASGRVSGPHLHWGVKVNGVAVNPLQFVEVIASLIEK